MTATPSAGALERDRSHRIRWFARFPGHPEDWTPANAQMVRSGYGWDVRCSCGQATGTGGATQAHIADRVYWHTHLGAAL